MNQKNIGIFLIILSLLIGSFVLVSQKQEKKLIEFYIQNENSCYLEDGTCLHEEASQKYTIGWIIVGLSFILGLYLIFIDKTQKVLTENQLKISKAFRTANKKEKKKNEFEAFLSGFEKDQQKILKIINEEEGITQSTLKFKSNISKTRLSLILTELEKREIISRKPHKKTKKLFIIKKF